MCSSHFTYYFTTYKLITLIVNLSNKKMPCLYRKIILNDIEKTESSFKIDITGAISNSHGITFFKKKKLYLNEIYTVSIRGKLCF